MDFTVNCPYCGLGLAVAHEHVGKQGKCSGCGAVFDITPPPSPGPASPPANGPIPLAQAAAGLPGVAKPGKVQAISIMILLGGIWALLHGVGFLAVTGIPSAGACCLWPGGYYSLVLGIMALVAASKLLGQQANLQPPPKTIAIMQIVNIVNGDVPNCAMGIVTLVFLNEPEVRQFFRG